MTRNKKEVGSEKLEESQSVSQKDVGGSAQATNINIQSVQNLISAEKVVIQSKSPYFDAKKYEETDKEKWNNDELIISIADMEMIKGIIKDAEEVEEAIPRIVAMKELFELLPKNHKSLLVIAIKTMIKEDKIRSKVLTSDSTKVSDETLDLMNILENEDELKKKSFSLGYYINYKKVYNIIRSGDLDNKILPYIKQLKKEHGGDESAFREAFLVYWGSRLSNHPYAVFISSQDKAMLKGEILSKFDNSEGELVRVFAKGRGRIIKASWICNEIAILKGLKLEEEKYQIGYDEASTFIFEND